MLQLIVGPAGSGKTYTLHRLISQKAADGCGGIILLTPEQNSFESERDMLRLLGPSVCDRVEVLSFSRLAETVEKITGGFAGRIADDSVKIIVMQQSVLSVKDELSVYKRSANDSEFCKKMLDIITEFKQQSLTPSDLDSAARKLSGSLAAKARDIALIMSVYDALLARSYVDPLDSLTRLYERLCNVEYLRGKTVFIDAFKGFTEQQYRILQKIIEQADGVYITVCADSLNDTDGGMGVFSNVKNAAGAIVAMANSAGRRIASPIVLTGSERFHNPELAELRSILSESDAEYDGECEHITLCSAATLYDEVDYVARTIRRLVRTKEMRYSDFAVIARNASDYSGAIDSVFAKYGIPKFFDSTISADSLALMKYVISALNTARSGFSAEHLIPYIKSALSPIDTEMASELENYAFVWKISGKDWLFEWTDSPDGFGTSADKERLDGINESRKLVTEPVLPLADALASGNVKKICTEIYRFLIGTGADKRLREYASALESSGESALADIQRQSWDVIMNLLDTAVGAFGDSVVDARRFCDVFASMVGFADIGTIPGRLDEVIIGSADRIRPGESKAVFLIGANYRVFPQPPGTGGLFSVRDRRRLIECGLAIPDRSVSDSIDEQFMVYTSACCASEDVYICWHNSSLDGAKAAKSEFINRITDKMPKIRVVSEKDSAEDKLEAAVPAIELAYMSDSKTLKGALIDYFSRTESDYADVMEAVDRARSNSVKQLSKSTAVNLFGRDIRLSPSRAEVYSKCPFSYFCKYGIGAKPMRSAGLDVMQKGTLVHYVLEQMLRCHGKEISVMRAEERMDEIVRLEQRYAEENFGGTVLDKQFRYLLTRVAGILDAIVEHIGKELDNSDFVPDRFELQVGGDEVPEIELPLDEGSVRVIGTVDRVDIFTKDGFTFVRVIDYKTGSKAFDISDVLHGMNMQMLIYLFAVLHSGIYNNARPAGILYMPSKRSVPSVDTDADDDAVLSRKNSELKMKGLVLGDDVVLEAMEHGQNGQFMPFSRLKSGSLSAGSYVADEDGFGDIEREVRNMLVSIGERMHSGDIAVRPLDGTESNACKYCDYASVCLRDMEIPCDAVEKLKLDDALEILRNKYRVGEGE